MGLRLARPRCRSSFGFAGILENSVNSTRANRITLGQFSHAYAIFGLLIAAALLAPEVTLNLDRFRTIYTIWATIVLLIPAFCFAVFSNVGPTPYNYWRLFWTFSYVAYLFHFYWAVFVIFKGFSGTVAGQGALISGVNFVLTAWWGLDVVLLWLGPGKAKWVRVEQTLARLFVFLIFGLTTLVLRPTIITKALGVTLVTAVALSLIARVFLSERAAASQYDH